jgi:hypothetical protein
MSRYQNTRWLWIAVTFLFLIALPAPTLQAGMLYVYDLDSLVHLSTEVVEGEIIRSYKAHNLELVDVKVMRVDKGSFTKGQTVVVANTDYYRKPEQGDLNSQRLAVGDSLVLFVVQEKASEFFRIPEDAVIYTPLPGGMRLVQGDHLFGFSQRDNPGPYVADVPFDRSKEKAPTVEHFREEVRKSLSDTQEWARLVEAKQDKLDVPRLLKLLADRSRQTFDRQDYFTQRICSRFAETKDLELLSRALPLAKRYVEASILQHGFGSPKGREYLLAKVTDAKLPMPDRLRYSDALRNAGDIYRSTFTEIGANSYRMIGEADESNSNYLTRIAKAARATGGQEELCRSLLSCLDFFGQGIVQNKPAPLMTDLLGAFAVLKEFYETNPSEELRFAIEKATAYDREAYEKLQSPCGTFVSILRPADPAKYTKPEKPSLIFECEYATLLLGRDAEVQPSVVLIHQRTQKRVVLPTELRIRGRSCGGGSGCVELPKDLPAGKYRVLFQLGDGDKAISTGHYFVADL